MRFAATVKAVHSGDLGFLRCRHFYMTLTGEKRLGWSPVATKNVPNRCDPHERVTIEPCVIRAGTRACGALVQGIRGECGCVRSVPPPARRARPWRVGWLEPARPRSCRAEAGGGLRRRVPRPHPAT